MEPIGNSQMCVTISSAEPDSDGHWAHRAEVLARWLAAEWRREHGREVVMVD
jgi:hypothetical protein